MDRQILEELRARSLRPGKQKTWISGLDDSTLWRIFLLLKAGHSHRSVARELRAAGSVEASEASIAAGVNKFAKRIADLLTRAAKDKPTRPGEAGFPESNGKVRADREDAAQVVSVDNGDDLFTKLERIEDDFTDRIQAMLAAERESGIANPHFARELKALTDFVKARAKLEATRPKTQAAVPSKVRRGFDRLMSDVVRGDPDRFRRTAHRVLERLEEGALDVIRDKDGNKRLVEPGHAVPPWKEPDKGNDSESIDAILDDLIGPL